YGAEDLIGNRAFDLVAATGRLRGPRGGEGGSDTHPLAERYELRIRHRAGHWIDLRVIVTPLRDGADEPFAVLSSVADISDQKRQEQAREEVEERFRQLTETIRESFWIATADDLTPLYVSPAYEGIMGESRDHILATRRSLLDCI